MQKYSSGSPRVHITSDDFTVFSAILEYEEKITCFSENEQLFLQSLINDLNEELTIREEGFND